MARNTLEEVDHPAGLSAPQLDIIRRRYMMDRFNVRHDIPIEESARRLRRVTGPEDFAGKRVLEIGAGCSPYLQVFLDWNCQELVANDLMPERLELNGIIDPRYRNLPGDFLEADIEPSSFDVIFANLTLMFLVPLMGQVVSRIETLLAPGGKMITFDPNYICPLSIYRRYSDHSGANPARIFSPYRYTRLVEGAGLRVEKLVPFTSNLEWTVGSWLLGTSFGMKAAKPASVDTN